MMNRQIFAHFTVFFDDGERAANVHIMRVEKDGSVGYRMYLNGQYHRNVLSAVSGGPDDAQAVQAVLHEISMLIANGWRGTES